MSSYTPVLTTKLPGMPEEYKKYVYLIENDGEQGICKAIKNVFNKPAAERYAFGETAGKFIKENKNNVYQTKRMAEFLGIISR